MIPRVRRTIYCGEQHGSLVVMEHIKGKQLAQCWSSLSIWEKIRIACRYVRQLRQWQYGRQPRETQRELTQKLNSR
jgi:hypothetical protein